jgi:hypothetical protein
MFHGRTQFFGSENFLRRQVGVMKEIRLMGPFDPFSDAELAREQGGGEGERRWCL